MSYFDDLTSHTTETDGLPYSSAEDIPQATKLTAPSVFSCGTA
jgi:hypothetical protein